MLADLWPDIVSRAEEEIFWNPRVQRTWFGGVGGGRDFGVPVLSVSRLRFEV